MLVNNAGWDRFVNFVDTTPDLWDQLIAINLRGPLNMSHVVLKGMVARGQRPHRQHRLGCRPRRLLAGGRLLGLQGRHHRLHQDGGARGGAQRASRSNAVCPGPTDTPLLAAVAGDDERGQKVRAALVSAIPMKRVGQPEDIPGAVCFLASDDAAFITGQTISVSGGLTMHG